MAMKEQDAIEERKLGNDFDILCQIYEDTVVNNDVAYLSKLIKETGYDRRTVDTNLDKLEFLGIIYPEYKKVGEYFRLCYLIDGYEALEFARALYENSEKVEETANVPR